ncbi:LysR family transcriptional regulator [Rhodococcus sp. 14-2470-1b]|uniref:LysR family transcriptional regulator n=1 Tax=Rhodococcus sp. 14-2470-1b TaxID=2023149 RepID=UPI000B9B6C20|nr:LysR substrate-binding domain-containing protein [Rhodococcus sp. 14-2470-1b]OZF52378.1 LysR family transcriptional regulator [Rhodococcus sp. 14-2470-1b]
MELRQLEYFVAVTEEANFTRAAERVNISQSGISAQIKALEKEVGAELIDRSSRVARLTVAGTAALVHARRALESSAALRHSVDEVLSLVRGKVAVGMVTACTVTPLFDALAAFHSAYPGVDITLAEANSDELIARVRSGALDVALVGTAHGPPEGLESLVMITEGLAACVPPGHPLSTASAVTLGEVCAHRVVCLPAGTGIRSVFDDACAAADITTDVALAASAPGAVADLAARGLGVAILSRSMATDFEDLLVSVPISDVPADAVLALTWSPRASTAAKKLTTYVSGHVGPGLHDHSHNHSHGN